MSEGTGDSYLLNEIHRRVIDLVGKFSALEQKVDVVFVSKEQHRDNILDSETRAKADLTALSEKVEALSKRLTEFEQEHAERSKDLLEATKDSLTGRNGKSGFIVALLLVVVAFLLLQIAAQYLPGLRSTPGVKMFILKSEDD